MDGGIKIIPNYIYFYHLDEFCVLPLYPDTITDTMGSKFAQTNALSRSAPVFSYIQSGPRSVSLSFKLHRDLMNDLNRDVSNIKPNVVDFSKDDYIDTLVKYLQSIALPSYKNYAGGSRSVIPPMVAVRFGNEVFIKGVVTSDISVTYNKPIMADGKYAQVDISFSISEVDPYDAEYVAGKYDNGEGGSFRGLFDSRFKGGLYKVETDSIPNPTLADRRTGARSARDLLDNTKHSNVQLKYSGLTENDNFKITQKKENIIIPTIDRSIHGGRY